MLRESLVQSFLNVSTARGFAGEEGERQRRWCCPQARCQTPPGALQEMEWVVRQEPWAHLPPEDWVDLPQLQLQEEWGWAAPLLCGTPSDYYSEGEETSDSESDPDEDEASKYARQQQKAS